MFASLVFITSAIVVSDCFQVFHFLKDDVFSFASYYQDNMVLQREPHKAVVWGYGTLGATVIFALEEDVQTVLVKSGPTGKGVWSVVLNPRKAGGPYFIKAVQKRSGTMKEITLSNVLFGDVWFCGGQSNMQFTLSQGYNATEEIQRASNYPNVRLFTAALRQSDDPLYDLAGIEENWSPASEKSVGGPAWSYFSAVCWLYGSYLYDELKIPIGLVDSDWGGTPVEAWSSPRALEECGLSNSQVARSSVENKLHGPRTSSVLWNGMVHPLLNMTIKGVVWYQGESNVYYHNSRYNCSFPAMIRDWRRSWTEGTSGQTDPEFPFGFVQISTTVAADDGAYAMLRWHQTADYGYAPNEAMPNTFMAVALDLPDDDSPYGAIHPRDKQDVGKRLSMASFHYVYGLDFCGSGPVIQSAVQSDQDHVIVNYPMGEELVVEERKNFEVCCNFSTCDIAAGSPSPNWIWALIQSTTSNTVTLDVQPCVEGGGHASMIRYAWALQPCAFKQCSVYNAAGLPAPPFIISVDHKQSTQSNQYFI